MRRFLLALVLAAATPLPALAAASYVGAVRYDDARRTFTIETSGTPLVQTKRLINPDRLVIDVRDAVLAVTAPREQAINGRRVRGFTVTQVPGSPELVRIVVALQPKVEPLLAVRQSPGRVTITFEQPPVPKGERELETLPPVADNLRLPEPSLVAVPSPPPSPPVRKPIVLPPPPSNPLAREPIVLPSPPPLPAREPAAPPSPSPLPVREPAAPRAAVAPTLPPVAPRASEPPSPPAVATPAPERSPTQPFWAERPAPSPTPGWQQPALTPIAVAPPPEPQAEEEEDARPLRGFGSTLMLRWQQVEALDDYGASTGPVFAYPAGVNGVELRHWITPWLGFGLDSRLLNYDMAAEGVSLNRTDLLIQPALIARYPLLGGRIEPTLHLGYLARHITAYAHTLGSTLPFAPTQFHHGYALGLGGRFRLLPTLSLQLDYHLLPAVGGNLFQGFGSVFPLAQNRYSAQLMFDVGPGYLSVGYAGDAARGSTYSQYLNGILAGAGWRY